MPLKELMGGFEGPGGATLAGHHCSVYIYIYIYTYVLRIYDPGLKAPLSPLTVLCGVGGWSESLISHGF